MSSTKSTRKRSPHDFIFKQELGHGSYSTVYKAIDRNNVGHVYAIKVCSKAHIIKENKVKYVTIEKNTLNLLARAGHPGVVRLYYTFHDEENLYFVLDYASHGELLQLLHKMGRFSESWSLHFTCQLIDTIEFIHSKGIIHRDLKPENLLLNSYGRLMITDFGTATTPQKEQKEQQQQEDDEIFSKCSSFVGTAEYVSPELLLSNRCDFSSDIWALGCIIYQFIVGTPPFRGKNELQTFEKIASLDYPWNDSHITPSKINPVIVRLVKKILVLDPLERLSLSAMKKDSWFDKIDWSNSNLIWRSIWQIPEYSNGFTQRPHIISNKPLHVIDTPLRSIPITKQKKKKPAKVSNTTSSIVEWRKKLGISQVQLQSQIQAQTQTQTQAQAQTQAQTQAPLPIQPQTQTQSPTQTQIQPQSQAQQPQLPAQLPKPVVLGPKVAISSRTIQKAPLQASHIPPQQAGIQPVQRSTSQPSLTVNTSHNALSRPFTNPEHSYSSAVNDREGSFSPQRPNSIVLKQDCTNIFEIPYRPEGPQMSLKSYNKIDNEIITELVSRCRNELQSSSKSPKLLTLFKDGTLSYKSDGFSKHIVNVGDSDLSMYDFEFYEKENKGFLILEKYRYKIWFISLPKTPANVPLGPIINRSENWVDCFFRARQMLEDQPMVGSLQNLKLEESVELLVQPSSNSSPLLVHPSSNSSPLLVSEGSKESNKRGNSKLNKKRPSIASKSASSSQNGISDRRQISSAPSPNLSTKHSDTEESPSDLLPPISAPPMSAPPKVSSTRQRSSRASSSSVHLSSHTANVIRPNGNRSLSSGPMSPPSASFARHNGVRSSPASGHMSPPTSPHLQSPSQKKYSVPNNMVISSSRYEVLHALKQNTGTDVASSGASAAFRSLQKKK